MMTSDWIEEKLGAGKFKALAEQVEAGWTFPLLPSTAYDIYPLNAILDLATKEVGVTVTSAVTVIARRNAEKDLTTIYRAFMRAAGPRALLQATPHLWRNYVAFAEAKKITNVPGHLVAECRMIPADVFDWAMGCWHGFLPAAIELAGGTNARSKIIDRGDEDQAGYRWLRAEYHYEWKA
ncbi:hypothetical protein PPSIR1_04083 [Plesiocystis pacifica SIR-1]|uniref:Uncharacterized protein n=2 Tax=Plesiocystis pacifica TaxID=191768 RepID=A6G4H5_9BACT|nr:hypothetical protein PPSIR1_04083 [Plesiocystis pacifica SIR-1]